MVSSDGPEGRKLSRRNFVGSVGAVLAAGAIGIALNRVRPQQNGPDTPAVAKPSPQPEYRLTRIKPLPPVAKNSFSIFWITDTQFLSQSNPALFRMAANWIVDNWTNYNGKLVIHTGDIVQTGSDRSQWQNADEALTTLLDNGIPYTWCAGNHDDTLNGDPTSGWSGSTWASSLNPSVVSSKVNALGYARWVGDYHDAMNTAVAFSANGLDFLVVNLEWNAPPDVLDWLSNLLDDPNNSNSHVIVGPHAYIDAQGSLTDPRWETQLATFLNGLTPILDAHSSNVFLTLNGHFATECGYNTPTPVNDRNQLMFDRQDCFDRPSDLTGRGVDNADVNPNVPDSDRVGGATVVVLTFDIDKNEIEAKTFDVYTGKWRTNEYEQYKVPMFSTTASSP